MAKLKMKTHPATKKMQRLSPPPSPFDDLPVGTKLAVSSPHHDDWIVYCTFVSHDWVAGHVHVEVEWEEGYMTGPDRKKVPYKRQRTGEAAYYETANKVFSLR